MIIQIDVSDIAWERYYCSVIVLDSTRKSIEVLMDTLNNMFQGQVNSIKILSVIEKK